MDPSILTVLDISPYNIVLIHCNITQPETVTLTKSVMWKRTSPSGRVQTLNNTGTNTNITHYDLEDTSSLSVLSVYIESAGTWRFTCIASVDVSDDPLVLHSETATVTAKGNKCVNTLWSALLLMLLTNFFRCICSSKASRHYAHYSYSRQCDNRVACTSDNLHS